MYDDEDSEKHNYSEILRSSTIKTANPETKYQSSLFFVRWADRRNEAEFRVNETGHVIMWGLPLWAWLLIISVFDITVALILVWAFWL